MPEALFYTKPVVLDRNRHRDLGLEMTRNGFTFAAHAHAVPLVGAEFPEAARSYPIVFATGADGQPFPVGVLGLVEGHNQFVAEDGSWRATYIPAFVRRYPFILTEQLTVCLDEAAPMLRRGAGERLFADDGQDAPLLTSTLDFLRQFNAETGHTRTFAARLAALDLLQTMRVQVVRQDGSSQTLDGLAVVDQRKLAALPDAEVVDLFRAGMLGWIYAHLTSLGCLADLGGPGARVHAAPLVERTH